MSATKRHIRILLLLAAGLLAGCVREDPPTPETQEEIRLNAAVWQMMQGAPALRAYTYDNAEALQGEAHFTCTAYTANTTTVNDVVNINNNDVTWNGSSWDFTGGKRYWPIDALHLDFFAYMPATIPSYITNMSDDAGSITYDARSPKFKCNSLPMTATGQSSIKEFIYSLVVDEYKGKSPSGIVLSFQHPFAKIYLNWSVADHSAITKLSLKLKGIKNNGSYTHSGGWTLTGDATNFTTTTLNESDADNPVPFLMVPQDWGGDIEVEADWIDWGENFTHILTTKVPTNWQAGYSYTYAFTIFPSELIVSTEKFTEQW